MGQSVDRERVAHDAVQRPILLSRRAVLRVFVGAGAGLLLTACGGDDLDPFAAYRQPDQPTDSGTDPPAQQADQQQAPEPAPAQEASQVIAAEPLPEPAVYVMPSPVAQGQTVLIVVVAPGADAASIWWQGQTFSLLHHEERFIGFFGIDANASVGPQSLGVAVWGPRGEQLLWQETVIEIASGEWTVDNIQIDGPNEALLDPAIRRADEAQRLPHQTGLTSQLHWLGVFDPPVDGAITALYGEQRSFNGGPIVEYHTGIDYGGETGTAVKSGHTGIVSWAGRTRRRGNGIIIDHGAGVFTGYLPPLRGLANAGRRRRAGRPDRANGAQPVLATGPHLHWEVVVRGITVNPLPWIRLLEFPDPHQELNPANAHASTNLANR